MQLERAVIRRRKAGQADGSERLAQIEPTAGDTFPRKRRQGISGLQHAIDDLLVTLPGIFGEH